MDRHAQILAASSNLLGICFVIIGGLKLTNSNPLTMADEVTWVAAVLLLFSTIASYFTIRRSAATSLIARLADYAFLGALFALMTAVLLMVVEL